MGRALIPKKRIDPLLKETAKILDYPPHVIGDVVKHSFKFIHDFIDSPTHAGLRYQNFGVIRGSLNAVNAYIQFRVIPQLRKDRTNEFWLNRLRTY